ncbi:S-adenosyl-L-methionine-dependent methyltransferase [Hesseltinella vesiculosa]|uniref:S-adenosyl-L-methionine-dependent methyltransferase n=1 Tax=Hesseltinella vesiculosa TaxID=101127 RepID=A0A1X2GHE2_9FUNG|nr:S-adenosyl-L-methionine-dependent methyltransferase [Hesseltinella vesiculosa]
MSFSKSQYDQPAFYSEYKQLDRSQVGLQAAGEWPSFQSMLPSLQGKKCLDIGCGYGWHCLFAISQGAASVLGIDHSQNMLQVAREKSRCLPLADQDRVHYLQLPMEQLTEVAGDAQFDVVISSLALHYVASFDQVAQQVARLLKPGGHFCFSVEHPIYTAQGPQTWCKDDQGRKLHWPVDRYFDESARTSRFLGQDVIKYHKTTSTYVQTLLNTGFQLCHLIEPLPEDPDHPDRVRRPGMLLMSATKP